MRTRIVKIGNSRGIRLPTPLLEQAGQGDEVELTAEAGQIVTAAPRGARAGWADAARKLAAAGEDELDPHQATAFDESEWKWP